LQYQWKALLSSRFSSGGEGSATANQVLANRKHAILEMADRNIQEFHPSSSQTIQVNKVMEQESKNTERLSCPTIVVGEVIQVSLLKFK